MVPDHFQVTSGPIVPLWSGDYCYMMQLT